MIFSTLKLNEDKPIYEQIENHIEEAVKVGTLIKGSKLPSTREASSVLGVSRNTILTAYENLESKEVIYSIKGKGSFIKSEAKLNRQDVKIGWKAHVNAYAGVCEAMDIIKTEPLYEKGMISFKSIAPEGSLFDIEEFRRAFLEVMAREGEKLLNYGYAKGYKPLIDYLIGYMEGKGVTASQKDILITNGFTEGLDIILSSYTRPKDVILCESPTHHTTLKMMKAYGLEIKEIPMDTQGIQWEALEEAVIKWQPKFVYLTPSYQNPTGVVMSGERRQKVYHILSKYEVPCIEDGFNEELLYSSSHIMPIMALSEGSNHIIYIGSLSKILFPGLRLGWIMADAACIDTLESVKRAKTIHTSFIDQAVFVQYMKSGAFERYVKKAKKYYRDKYLYTLEQVKKYIPYKNIWGEGGLYIYIELDETIDTRQLLEKCHKRGVIFMSGDTFYLKRSVSSSLRIGFSRLSKEEITQGLQVIGEEIGCY